MGQAAAKLGRLDAADALCDLLLETASHGMPQVYTGGAR
jgi:UDP-N-acetylglucosamine--N-acetylmuramyl-(pentapeptide) pyrophosphoryl-undecaprenol N-acetylglucosamine transferase